MRLTRALSRIDPIRLGRSALSLLVMLTRGRRPTLSSRPQSGLVPLSVDDAIDCNQTDYVLVSISPSYACSTPALRYINAATAIALGPTLIASSSNKASNSANAADAVAPAAAAAATTSAVAAPKQNGVLLARVRH